MDLSKGIWSRQGESTMSQSTYIRAIAFFTVVVGMLVPAGAVLSYNWEFSWWLLLGSFAVAIVSIMLFLHSQNPLVSLWGVSMMSGALGIMIGPAVALYTMEVIMQAVITTGAIMIIMSMVGIMYPRAFLGLGPYLIGTLSLLIISQFAQIIFLSLGFEQAVDMPWIAWLGVGVFTLMVAYDWSRALSIPYTLNNAIDASGGLILDAVNLFLQLVKIYAAAKGGGGYRK